MKLPEWAKWLARDESGTLNAYKEPPEKGKYWWGFDLKDGEFEAIRETDDRYKNIKWEDEFPTFVDKDRNTFKWLEKPDLQLTEETLNEVFKPKSDEEPTGISVAELNRITNAKAHGYDEVPEVADKTERVHVDKDGDETTTMSFEEVMALVENDMIDQPPHYIGNQGLEVEVVLQNFIPRYEDSYVGHRVASAIEYLLRSPLKNQRQDIEKAGKNIQQALAYLDMTEG